jgi:hypothetical protein
MRQALLNLLLVLSKEEQSIHIIVKVLVVAMLPTVSTYIAFRRRYIRRDKKGRKIKR